ncbi:MAG: 50S ribosomal protein L3 [Candidatus Gracilibacteria bacterium]|nr:50S ribosomal protein L3 [Candidatus Gracilibacteria bacterium]
MAGLLATKLEMTRIVKGNDFVPITLLKISTLKVVAIKTMEANGYNAMVVGVLKDGKEGILLEGKKSLNFSDFSKIKEFSLNDNEVSKFNVGDIITLDILDGVEKVEITGYSKGKGFAGAMKRHNFHGGMATHGSKFHRALGSIGNRKPRRTHKGKKMHGHMGDIKITLKKIPVEILNKDLSVLGLKGPVPGARNSLISIKF